MTHWTAQDWVLIIGAIAAGVALVIRTIRSESEKIRTTVDSRIGEHEERAAKRAEEVKATVERNER